MKKIDIGQTVSILANIGVIAGIVFLGVELRQNNELLLAQANLARNNIRNNDVLLPATNPDVGKALLKYWSGETLTDYEELILARVARANIHNLEYVFFEYSQGRIEQLPIEGWRLGFCSTEPTAGYYPDLGAYWEARKHLEFDPEFIEWVDENVVNGC